MPYTIPSLVSATRFNPNWGVSRTYRKEMHNLRDTGMKISSQFLVLCGTVPTEMYCNITDRYGSRQGGFAKSSQLSLSCRRSNEAILSSCCRA